MSAWLRRTLSVVIAGQCAALAAFIYAGGAADAAMDKSGIGDVVAFHRWSGIAGRCKSSRAG